MSRFLPLLLIGLGMIESLTAAPDRVPERIDRTRTSSLPRQVAALPAGAADLGPADPSMPISWATLRLTTDPSLDQFLRDVQTPTSPSYHRWLTPEDFAARFGVSQSDLGRIVAWLQGEGFTVHDTARGRHWITFSGTVAQAQRTFGAQFRRFTLNGETHFANTAELTIPEALAGVIAGVSGFSDLRPHRMSRMVRPEEMPDITSGAAHYIAPDDFAAIYDLTPLYAAGIDGTGQKIAITGQSDISGSDITAFRNQFGLPANPPVIKLVGQNPGTNSDSVEGDLDVEWAGAIARKATIIYVNSSDVRTSALYAVDQNLAPVISHSYGLCELYSTDDTRIIAQQAAAQGITWVAASGDAASAECDRYSIGIQASRGPTTSYPATIPEITAVGGTEFLDATGNYWSTTNSATHASALGYIPEKVWNATAQYFSPVGGGGGASQFYGKPSWQTGPGVPQDNARDIPDVAFAASLHTAYQIYSTGRIGLISGTSAAAPSFAGILALLNQSLAQANPNAPVGLGNINPMLYRMAQATTDVFHDVVTGDSMVPCTQGSPGCVNGTIGYAAGPGYDRASGLGSLDAANFVKRWGAGSASTVSLSASPSSPNVGDMVTVTVTVTGAASAPTGTVSLFSGTLSLGSVVLAATSATKSSGSISLASTLLLTTNSLSAQYNGDGANLPADATLAIPPKTAQGSSYVVATVTPWPVTPVQGTFLFTITLTEIAGTPTTLTGFTYNGAPQDPTLFSSLTIPAYGSVTAQLVAILQPPAQRAFTFSGIDANAPKPWSQSLTVPFAAAPAGPTDVAAIAVTTSPATIQQNASAPASCQWQQTITLRETGGFFTKLGSLSVGASTLKPSSVFGTSRLAPWGMLQGTVCLTAASAPGSANITISGTADTGDTSAGSGRAVLTGPATSPSKLSLSAANVQLNVPAGTSTASGTVNIAFDTGSPAWTAQALIPGHTQWLRLSATTGTGNATLTLTASVSGLSNGVYNAMLSVECMNTIPQIVQIPVSFTVGANSSISIQGVTNAASYSSALAPGALMAIFGTGLAPSTLIAAQQPLPLNLSGVSATVNGVSAPLWFVSAGQMNVQIPYETGAGPAVVGVNNNGAVASFITSVAPTGPGIFTDSNGFMVPVPSAAPNQTIFGFFTGDGELTPSIATGSTASGALPASVQPPVITIGGINSSIVFAGVVPGLIGVTQINFIVPGQAAPGVQNVVISVGGVASAPAKLTITAQ